MEINKQMKKRRRLRMQKYYEIEKVRKGEQLSGYKQAGIDEVGVESIAFGMVTTVVVMPEHSSMKPIDSKLISEHTIGMLYHQILKEAVFIRSFYCDAKAVDEAGTTKISKKMWKKCCQEIIKRNPEIDIVIDGKKGLPYFHQTRGVVGGDAKILSVSAASIVSKYLLDEMIIAESENFPMYGWRKNKGYARNIHLEAIQKHGITEFHRPKMTEKALKKGLKVESLTLPQERIEEMIFRAQNVIFKHPTATSEWGRKFLINAYCKCILDHEELTSKETYYLNELYKEMVKRCSRHKINMDVPLEPPHISRDDIYHRYQEITPFLRQHKSDVDEYTVNFLRKLFKPIKNNEQVSEKQKQYLYYYQQEILIKAQAKGA